MPPCQTIFAYDNIILSRDFFVVLSLESKYRIQEQKSRSHNNEPIHVQSN